LRGSFGLQPSLRFYQRGLYAHPDPERAPAECNRGRASYSEKFAERIDWFRKYVFGDVTIDALSSFEVVWPGKITSAFRPGSIWWCDMAGNCIF
jgi:hypothetical protein